MRRSICVVEPNTTLAGTVATWKFHFTPTQTLPKGSLLRFDLCSKGRYIDWETPSPQLKDAKNVIYAMLPNGKVLSPEPIDVPNCLVPQFQFKLPAELPAGQMMHFIIGAAPNKDPEKCGTRCQLMIQRRKPFHLFVDPTGKGNFHDPEVFCLDIKGNKLHTIKIFSPSFAIKNKRFDIVLRFEDEYGNLTCNAPEKTLVELSHQNLRENLNWKLFIPETGFIAVPNLYFNERGVYTIKIKNLATKQVFHSNPIKCFDSETPQLFWGLLHGESERYDSGENIDNCLRHFRDERSLNFYAVSPFENQEETPNDLWKAVAQNVEELDEEERFTTFLGFQWCGESSSEGLRQLVYYKDQKQILRKKDARSCTLKKLYKNFSPKEMIAIPCLTMAKNCSYSFADFNPEFERVVEIYNSWGSSERSQKDGNIYPISCTGKKGISESKEGACIDALMKNHRFGFVAGGLDDRGIYSDFYEGDQNQYSPGLTAILAETLTRPALFEALYNRHCYATTGERIIVGFFVAQQPMGSELHAANKPGLHVNRHITGYVAGTDDFTAELLRNGEVLTTFTSKNRVVDFAFDDTDPLQKVVIDNKDKNPPFVFYYLRVIQNDDHMAWSSPIWIDYSAKVERNKKK